MEEGLFWFTVQAYSHGGKITGAGARGVRRKRRERGGEREGKETAV